MALTQPVTFTSVTEVVSAAAQTQILTECAKFKTLIGNPAAGVSALHPDLDQMSPQMATRLRAFFDQLTAAIDAAPTA